MSNMCMNFEYDLKYNNKFKIYEQELYVNRAMYSTLFMMNVKLPMI